MRSCSAVGLGVVASFDGSSHAWIKGGWLDGAF